MQGVHPKDVCGVDGCDNVFHHMCQTAWEMYQYLLNVSDGEPKDFIYDTDEKKYDASTITLIVNWLFCPSCHPQKRVLLTKFCLRVKLHAQWF